ncbi:ribosome maturation factor RimP [Desulfopila inferna]|uniref:ribosome maturation factor RimP n=1 Tax=Desulfopila inferna TaxID=468528 RepID=UPI00196622BF|nr:ribosome maturation factor RimP [Desulfopila inferna]MBM9604580.1 ribosome maturation factor RimP [Desulfopila inferna]
MSDFVIKKIGEFADELLPSMGLELVEVQFRREQHGLVLRIFIDGPDGVNLDHCSMVSRELGDYLDVEDLIEHQYHLEVSSPGLERKLSRLKDFERFHGRKAKIKMHLPIDGEKTFIGVISRVDGESIFLEMEGGKELEFTFDMVSVARLAI